MTFLFYFILFIFIGLCALTSLIILMQESKTMGLGASFGGDSSSSLFGTSTADVLKKLTGYLVLIFMITCVCLSLWTASLGRQDKMRMQPSIEESA